MASSRRFWSWLVNKFRYRRLSVSTNIKMLAFGGIYYGNYSNYKNDPTPLIWVQYSDARYTHGINIHYLSSSDKAWLASTIYLIKKGNQVIDGLTFYKLLKLRRYSIVEKAYRLYFTNLLNMKLVSAGITNLDRLIYTSHRDPWILSLNEMIKPSGIFGQPPQIAFSQTELQDRIIASSNATFITKRRVGNRSGAFGTAPFIRK